MHLPETLLSQLGFCDHVQHLTGRAHVLDRLIDSPSRVGQWMGREKRFNLVGSLGSAEARDNADDQTRHEQRRCQRGRRKLLGDCIEILSKNQCYVRNKTLS